MSEFTRVIFLVPLRIFCGWVFLHAGYEKLRAGWLTHPEVAKAVGGWLHGGQSYPFIVPFLRDTVLTHAQLFSILVSIGEVTVGALLLIGFLTRASAIVGLLMTLTFLLARGDGFAANATCPFVIMTLTLALTAPGAALGLDGFLRNRAL